ncbi:MAG: WD40 repeat domain-containing protein [Mucilaginibacter sp.]
MKTVTEKVITFNVVAALRGHTGCIYALDRGLSGNTIFTGGSDQFIAQWNLETFEGTKFATSFTAHLYAICYIPEKGLLIAGTTNGRIHIIDVVKKKEIRILKNHRGPVFDIKYSLKTSCFYTAGGDGQFAVCSLDTLSLITIKRLCAGKVRSIDFNDHTSEIAVALGSGHILVYDLFTLQGKYQFPAHQLSANVVRYSPDGKILLTGGRDAYLNAWETVSYGQIKSIPAHNWAIYDIVYSPDARLFATGSRDKTVKIWDAATNSFLKRISKQAAGRHSHSVNKLLWSPYNDYLISVGDDKEVMIREVRTEKNGAAHVWPEPNIIT